MLCADLNTIQYKETDIWTYRLNPPGGKFSENNKTLSRFFTQLASKSVLKQWVITSPTMHIVYLYSGEQRHHTGVLLTQMSTEHVEVPESKFGLWRVTNPAYGRHCNSQLEQREAPIPKRTLEHLSKKRVHHMSFIVTNRRSMGQTDVTTYRLNQLNV